MNEGHPCSPLFVVTWLYCRTCDFCCYLIHILFVITKKVLNSEIVQLVCRRLVDSSLLGCDIKYIWWKQIFFFLFFCQCYPTWYWLLPTFNVPIDHLCYSFKGVVKVQQYNTSMTIKVLDLLKSKSIPCYIPKANCQFLYILIALIVDRALWSLLINWQDSSAIIMWSSDHLVLLFETILCLTLMVSSMRMHPFHFAFVGTSIVAPTLPTVSSSIMAVNKCGIDVLSLQWRNGSAMRLGKIIDFQI